ncbi:MAG: energy transducer TonB, partial [Verrucomicrobiota bacterium]
GLTPPTVFTGGRDLAFWDAAERRLPRTGYGLAEWTPPDRWLENLAGRWLPGLPEPPRLPPARRIPPPALAVLAPALPLRTVTELGLGADLAQRGLESSGAAPAGGAGEVSGDTVVEVMVDARGMVLSARLAQGCGQRANDEAAVAHARGLRFHRLPGVDRARELDPSLLRRDQVRYRWASAPPVSPGTPAPPGLR